MAAFQIGVLRASEVRVGSVTVQSIVVRESVRALGLKIPDFLWVIMGWLGRGKGGGEKDTSDEEMG